MSSIMRWRNGLMGLSVMAMTPVSHEVSEPHDLETGRAILLIPTSNPPRARSRWGVYRESGLVRGGIAAGRDRNRQPRSHNLGEQGAGVAGISLAALGHSEDWVQQRARICGRTCVAPEPGEFG